MEMCPNNGKIEVRWRLDTRQKQDEKRIQEWGSNLHLTSILPILGHHPHHCILPSTYILLESNLHLTSILLILGHHPYQGKTLPSILLESHQLVNLSHFYLNWCHLSILLIGTSFDLICILVNLTTTLLLSGLCSPRQFH